MVSDGSQQTAVKGESALSSHRRKADARRDVRIARKQKKAEQKAAVQKVSRRPFVGRLLLVILAFVLCILPIPFVNNVFGYLPLATLVFLLLISFIYLQVLRRSLTYSEDTLLDSCRRNSDVDFSIQFKNKSPFVFVRLEGLFYISDLFGGIDTSIPASLVLMPFEERTFEFAARFNHIGVYEAGVDRLVIWDLLGLFSYTIVNENRHGTRVLPKVFDVSGIDLSNISVHESSRQYQPIVTDDMDYAGVREYIWGDPLKTIHWKLSARLTNGNYYTRLFETQGNPGVEVVVDTTSPEYDTESLMEIFDGVIESALSVCLYGRERGLDPELVYTNRDDELCKMQVASVGDSMRLIDEVPRVKVDDDSDTLEYLRGESRSIYAKANIVLCTAHVDDDIITTLMDIKLRKLNPLLFVVVPKALEGDERRKFLAPLHRLEEADIAYSVINSAADLYTEDD